MPHSKWGCAPLSDYLHHWLETYCEPRLARNTVNGYRTNIERHIIPYVGGTPLDELEPEQMEAMEASLKQSGLSSTTVLYVHATLRKALNTAVKHRIIDCNVLDYIDAPLRARFKPVVLDAEQVLSLLDSCVGTEVYMPVLLAVVLGLRRGEVLGLKWSDIDWNMGTVEVSRSATFYKQEFVLADTKTKNSNRTLLLADELLSTLKVYRSRVARSERDLIVCRADGGLLTSTVLNRQFQKALQAAGLPHMRFHDLRHTNATLMLKQDIPAKIVSGMLGHASVGITLDLYSHVLTEMQRPAAIAMNRLLEHRTV